LYSAEVVLNNVELFYLRPSIPNCLVILSMHSSYPHRITLLLSLAIIAGCTPGTDPGECTIGCREVRVDLKLIERNDRYADTAYFTRRAEAQLQFHGAGEFDVSKANTGSVEVNSIVLGPERGLNISYRTLLMARSNPPSSLGFAQQGMYNRWMISGGLDMYPIRDSILTPSSPVSLLSPVEHDTLTLSEDFVVRRTTVPEGDTADYLVSIVAGENNDIDRRVYMEFFASTQKDTLWVRAANLVSQGFVPGPITITLSRSEKQLKTTADGRSYNLHFIQYDVIHTAFRR
jgi:hypothetical protein